MTKSSARRSRRGRCDGCAKSVPLTELLHTGTGVYCGECLAHGRADGGAA